MDEFWKKSAWEKADQHLVALKSQPFQRTFPFIPHQNGTYFIRGPRQVGKSSWLKSILSEGVAKQQNCFYLSCENLADHKDLAELLKSIRDRDIVLLDEISFVREWWRAVKHELDRGSFPILVLTGSHANDIRHGMDQMPGRWGHGGEFHLLPMDFAEFSAMRRQAGWPVLSRLEELRLYFRVGGFPTALLESGADSGPVPKAEETYRRWLLGDVTRLGKQEAYLREFLLAVAQTTTSTISLQKLAQKTQMGSHHTAQEYVQVLEDCFALKTLYALDLDTFAYRFKKEKKFYLRDPLIYRLAFTWAGMQPPETAEEALAELVAHEHLSRLHKRMGYLSTSKGEVDFVAPDPWALEVKWSASAQHLSRAYKDLRMTRKVLWTQSNFLEEWP